jgi:hypothetical protein
MWQKINKAMAKKNVHDPNFKGFMANIVHFYFVYTYNAMNIITPRRWKRLMFNMWPFICWWYSLGVANEVGFQRLENWFYFWHFFVWQWGGS